jgi:hypothetical protein
MRVPPPHLRISDPQKIIHMVHPQVPPIHLVRQNERSWRMKERIKKKRLQYRRARALRRHKNRDSTMERPILLSTPPPSQTPEDQTLVNRDPRMMEHMEVEVATWVEPEEQETDLQPPGTEREQPTSAPTQIPVH